MSAAIETGGERRQDEPSQLQGEGLPADAACGDDLTASAFERIPEPAALGPERAASALDAGRVGAVPPHGLLQAFQSLIYIIIIALFIITFTVQPFRIPSASMEPTLLVGDFLLVDKAVTSDQRPEVFAPTDRIQRGDLIVFHYPVEPALHLVKRVAGLPGDRVRLHDGRLYIDDRAIPEPYAVFLPSAPDNYRDDFPRMASADPGVDSRWWIQMRSLVANGELTVPADSYFVLGDNRNDSEDSRYWGFVPRAAIVGKPFLIYFSLRNLDDAPDQFATANGPAAGRHDAQPGSRRLDFARWDRVMRIIY